MPNKNKKINASNILNLEAYSKERKSIRARVVEMKKNRRVSLGPYSTFYFENFYTMQAQIQEMLYIEKGGEEQLKDELEAYNPLIPQGKELVATFMFEIDNPETRKKILSNLGNVEKKIFLNINNQKIYATPEDDLERIDEHGKTVLNTPGTIDSDYRGEIKVILMNLGKEDFEINQNDRIAQIIFSEIVKAKFEEVEILDETKRGPGGFGSTDQ